MAGISLILQNNPNVTTINCGTSSPRLGGTVDISAFPNLRDFRCSSNDITAISGYANNSNIKDLRFNDNKITGTLPSLSSLTNLETFWFNNNLLSGQLPNLSGLNKLTSFLGFYNYFTGPIPVLTGCPLLVDFRVSTQLGSVGNRLTGQIPSLSGLTFLQTFSVAQNDLSGPVPNLDSCSSLAFFNIQQNTDITGPLPSLTATKNSLYFFNIWFCSCTGPLPSLSGFNALDEFVAAENRFTGSIPAFGVLPRLRVYNVGFQRTAPTLQGSIPSLSGLSTLQIFYCATNQLTGFDGGSVSNTLGNFQAQNNQLSATAVNAILAAFVAAGRTSANGTCILNLGGVGNAAPTGQGLTDKATLVSRGWTVTTN